MILETLRLLLGSVIYRPYVYVFFVCFLFFAVYHLGLKRMLTFLVSTYLIAYFCEYSSTRNGFPFGPYTYIDTTRDRELWISNVPFWDSLSFVFLSYFSFVMAAALLMRENDLNAAMRRRPTPWLGGVLMMLLDVVIDPVALQGEKWFLGKIYNYPYEGFYFGVTAANFAGWFFVGYATQSIYQRLLYVLPWCRGHLREMGTGFVWASYAVYSGVFLFNLVITLMIKDYRLAAASALVTVLTMVVMGLILKAKTSDSRQDWPKALHSVL